ERRKPMALTLLLPALIWGWTEPKASTAPAESSLPVKQVSPEEKAVAYLASEVPAWSRENKCFSCHNNGDAARALFQAIRHGYDVPKKSLEDTNRWLTSPDKWDKNGGEEKYSDKGVARLQFALALTEALESGQVKDTGALQKAADLVASGQRKNG